MSDENEVLLIVDEIQTGFGRTGRMFACKHSNTTSDIMTVSKSLGGLGLPLAAIVYGKRLDMGTHVGTFRGNVLALMAGLAAIDFMQENRLDHINKVGDRILRMLRSIEKESEYIEDMRGWGLMIETEFVKDRGTKKPWKDIVDEIQKDAFKKGIIV